MRILLIEDDPGLGSAVRDEIAAGGHVPDLAPTLAYARDLVATMSYDLILLDLGLPDGRGLDFLIGGKTQRNKSCPAMDGSIGQQKR